MDSEHSSPKDDTTNTTSCVQRESVAEQGIRLYGITALSITANQVKLSVLFPAVLHILYSTTVL